MFVEQASTLQYNFYYFFRSLDAMATQKNDQIIWSEIAETHEFLCRDKCQEVASLQVDLIKMLWWPLLFIIWLTHFVGENDIYGITGIPSTVGGRGVVRRAGLGASTRIVYPGSGREDA